MKYLGIDYGTKTIGIAVSDAQGTIAFPRIELKNNSNLIKEIKNVIAKAFKKQIHITYYTDQVNQDELKEALEKEGYNVIEV